MNLEELVQDLRDAELELAKTKLNIATWEKWLRRDSDRVADRQKAVDDYKKEHHIV